MATGTRTTYTDTNLKKIVVADAIQMIDWQEAPLLKLLGTDNTSKFGLREVGTKVEWLEDTMSPRATTMNDSGGISAGDTTVTVATGTGSYFKTGDVISIESELIRVSSVSTDTLTITRGFGGTTAASHADALTMELVTHAALEGADSVTGHTTTITRPYNHSQILEEAIRVSGSEKEDPKWDDTDTMTRHLEKLMGGGGKAGKLPILLEQTFARGRRAAGTTSTARAMGGFNEFVTTNLYALSGAVLTRTHIENAFQACFEAGGAPDTIVCPAWARRKISIFYEKYITTTRSETRGGSRITEVQTDFGDMEVAYWRWCPTDTLYIIEKAKMGWCTMRPFAVYDRASIGDYDLKSVLGEYTFCLTNEKAHAKISGFSTVA